MSQYEDNGFDVGDDLDQAVGLQHAELVADLQDKPFFQECLISGPFGTVDNPVKIESVLGYRIVGCTGASRQSGPCGARRLLCACRTRPGALSWSSCNRRAAFAFGGRNGSAPGRGEMPPRAVGSCWRGRSSDGDADRCSSVRRVRVQVARVTRSTMLPGSSFTRETRWPAIFAASTLSW
jgi:hypothetical protein